MTRKSIKAFDKSITDKVKSNPKAFWINKYVHYTPKGKVYACFVDFKKPMIVFGRRVSSENLNV